MVIPTENREWRQSGTQPRRALLNNFGAAGSNVALLLEERPQLQLTKIMDERPCHVFNLSAKSRKALQTMISEHLEFLNQGRSLPSLKDICYTATARRQIYDHRISMVCNSVEDMKVKLEKASFATVNPSPPSKLVVFLFSGQGSLYRGMSEGLMDTCAYFREQVHHCDKIVQDLGFPSFLGFFSGGQAGPGPLMDSVEMVSSQCACFSLQYSLARLLMSWNIVPTHAAGHRYATSQVNSLPLLTTVQSRRVRRICSCWGPLFRRCFTDSCHKSSTDGRAMHAELLRNASM